MKWRLVMLESLVREKSFLERYLGGKLQSARVVALAADKAEIRRRNGRIRASHPHAVEKIERLDAQGEPHLFGDLEALRQGAVLVQQPPDTSMWAARGS